MSIVYIDLEYDNNHNLIEIGTIHICNNKVQNEFHRIIRQFITDKFSYYRCAENSHCIPIEILAVNTISCKQAIAELKSFFDNIMEPFTLKGHGHDVNEFNLKLLFPFLKDYATTTKISYEQATLPPWKERHFGSYHIAASTMKRGSQLMSCQPKNHKVPYFPYWRRKGKEPNHSQLAKHNYGYHCALIDAYELAFFEETLPCYCCDTHFKEHIQFENYNPSIVNLEVDYTPVIIDDTLIFLDDTY